ncbi:hypothetical protein KC359_g29 [Hortaea werneckii]|nr:hypothetical protein KC359_g29 [Hortaea werneckii]
MAGRTSLSPILLTCARAVFQHKTGSIPVSLPNHQAHLKTPQVSTPTTAAGSSKSVKRDINVSHTAIATQQRLTYGLNLSPIRAARQKVPSGLKGPKEQSISQHFGK